jgi:hypothetical protein
MKTITLATLLVLAGLFAAAPDPKWGADNRFAAAAKGTALLHCVTPKPLIMDSVAATLCDSRAAQRVPHSPHDDAYFQVFVNDAGLPALESGKGTYPVGALIVKQKYADAEGKKTELYTLMQKREPGYDPEHGDWEYAIVNQTAKQVLARGRLESCIACHKAHDKTDYVTRAYPITAPKK